MNIFSDRLRDLRICANMKQSEMAEILGVSTQSYSAYETGREPKYDLLVKIANHFDVTCDYLIGKSNAQKAENEALTALLGLGDKAIEDIQRCSERGLDIDDFISNTYFFPLMLHYTAYKKVDDLVYLAQKLGLTFHESITDAQKKRIIYGEMEDSLKYILGET